MRRQLATTALKGATRLFDTASEGARDAARVSRFLRGRLEFNLRDDDIFVVTYPRSGTTWLQFLLHLLATSGDDDFAHISDVTPWFERSLALGTRTAKDFDALPSPRIFKSHLHPAWLPEGARAVYVVRDGLDVAVSYYHLYRSHLGYEGGFDAFFERYLRGDVQYKSWFKHVAAWRAHAARAQTARAREAVLLLEYERLLEDLPGATEQLLAFTGFRTDRAALPTLLEKASFAYMKAHEDRFDHATGERAARTGAFIRNGTRGEGRARLTAAQRAAFERRAKAPPRFASVELDLAPYLH